jgi:hypothetical protein
LKRLSAWFRKISTTPITLAAVLIFFLFTALVLPKQSSQAQESSGGAGTPDLSFFYSSTDLYRWAGAYGEAGRQAYVRSHFTFDVAWPLVYTFFLITALSWLYGRSFPPDSPWQLVNLAPLLAVLFDFLENLTTSLVMALYPAQTWLADSLAFLATISTPLKWIFVGACMVLLLAGLAAFAWRRITFSK